MRTTRKKRTAKKKDPKKEMLFKSYLAVFEEAGIAVRREKLRRGLGWQVHSGNCRLERSRLVLVDQRLSQDDQLAFLRDQAQQFGIVLDPADGVSEARVGEDKQ